VLVRSKNSDSLKLSVAYSMTIPMIKHIVFFSAKDPQDIPVITRTLLAYRAIPSVLKLEVAENLKCDGVSNEVDIVLYAEFASKEDLEAYKAHPLYQEGIRTVRPLRELRYCADFCSPA
jgi:quinol monooxygenase YgiN